MPLDDCTARNTYNFTSHHHVCISLFFPFSSLHKQTQMLSCIQSKLPINVPTSYWDWYSSHQIRGCKHLHLV